MDVSGLWTLQCMMFLLVAAGAILKRGGILGDEGKTVLTDMVLYFFLPCNIITSFQMEFSMDILARFAVVLGISIIVQSVSFCMSKSLYQKKPDEIKRVLQYCTIVSNSGFLGLPIAAGVYGVEGMMYASIFIIPMRILMWSAGIACFTESPDIKTVVRKIAVHPCIIAVYIGLCLLIFQRPLGMIYAVLTDSSEPQFRAVIQTAVRATDKAVHAAGGCTTAFTMILIGMMLADVKAKDMINREALGISLLRLGILPFLVLMGCRIFRVDVFLTGICVLITGMPAGSTSAILAAKYGCDYVFATKCVVVSTMLSMVTIPLWCLAV